MRSGTFFGNHLLLILGVIWLLAAALIILYSVLNPSPITVEWSTATEQNTAGFNIYRSTTPDGGFELITADMIPSEGSAVTGADYNFEDNAVVPGETYFYLLEEIELDASVNRYADDMKARRVSQFDGITIVLVAFTALVGIGLIVAGLREDG